MEEVEGGVSIVKNTDGDDNNVFFQLNDSQLKYYRLLSVMWLVFSSYMFHLSRRWMCELSVSELKSSYEQRQERIYFKDRRWTVMDSAGQMMKYMSYTTTWLMANRFIAPGLTVVWKNRPLLFFSSFSILNFKGIGHFFMGLYEALMPSLTSVLPAVDHCELALCTEKQRSVPAGNRS